MTYSARVFSLLVLLTVANPMFKANSSRVETPPINSKFLQKLKVDSHCSFNIKNSGTLSIKRNEQR